MSIGAKGVESPQRKVFMLGVKKTGGGTPVLSGTNAAWMTVTKNGTGDYTINLVKFPLDQVPEVVTGSLTSAVDAYVGTVSGTAIQILTKSTAAGTATDGDFHLIILGCKARDLLSP